MRHDAARLVEVGDECADKVDERRSAADSDDLIVIQWGPNKYQD